MSQATIVRARQKALEDLPEWALCCDSSVNNFRIRDLKIYQITPALVLRDLRCKSCGQERYDVKTMGIEKTDAQDEQIPWDKLTTLTNKVCDRYGISHYPEESPGDFDFCEGSIAWLAVEAYRLGRARLSSEEGE